MVSRCALCLKLIPYLMILFFLAGCAMRPVSSDGLFVAYKHGKALFSVVESRAEEECATVGKLANHDRTDCRHLSVLKLINGFLSGRTESA